MTSPMAMKESYLSARPNEHFHYVGLVPELVQPLDFEHLSQLGIQLIMGNSANLARRLFAEEVAQKLEVPYAHADLSSGVDELPVESYLAEYPDGLSTLSGILHYQKLVAMSKFGRIWGLSNASLQEIGIVEGIDPRRILLLLADSVSIVDDKLMEKPKGQEEAIDQIENLVFGNSHFIISNVQLAMLASGAHGIGVSAHLLPVRVKQGMTIMQRKELKSIWRKLYENISVTVTPGAVSVANAELLPFVEVGLMPHADDHVISGGENLYGVAEIDWDLLEWHRFLNLPGQIRNELGTTLTGSSPRGFAQAITSLRLDMRRVDRRFPGFSMDLARAIKMVNGQPMPRPGAYSSEPALIYSMLNKPI